MTGVRAAKSKGSQFEMDCAYSLKKIYPELKRLGPEGFQAQYDLECDSAVFECKRLKSLSWNQAKTYFNKLSSVTEDIEKHRYLLFKSNRQPCLVMYWDDDVPTVRTFEDVFGVPFEKHPSTRSKKE